MLQNPFSRHTLVFAIRLLLTLLILTQNCLSLGGGGVTTPNCTFGIGPINSTVNGGSLTLAALQVTINEPDAAWSLSPTGSGRPGGVTLSNLTPGTYTIYFAPVSGLLAPPPSTVTLTGGYLITATATYADLLGGTLAGTDLEYSSWIGYYTYSSYPFVYVYGLGYEYVFPSGSGYFFYDYQSGHFWYTEPDYFPFVYDFSLNTYLYYYPGNGSPRYFYDYSANQVISE